MSKKLSKIVLSLIIVIAVTAMAACGITTLPMINDADKPQYADGNVPLTDLAATYKGDATDSEGNLLAPFDVVYPEAFESGEYAYDETAALLKFSKTYDGTLTKDLKSCGFKNLEKVSDGLNGAKWYRAEVADGVSVTTAIKKARSLNAVLTADYDYLYENEATVSEGENETDITATETSRNGETNANEGATEGEGAGANGIIDEVLQNLQVKDQWYLTACSIQRAWRFLQEKGISAGGSPSVTVAVIDTGVDYTHPDLKTNMWINTGEIPGNGIDDDGNGYVDDVYGCSTISDERFHSGDPMDDHGHGTHVAGIIAAANNKVGTVGVAYDTKIMAVKAGQATGVFLQSDIAEAITYAYTQGADVINMSFGGSACSIAVQEALQQAYTTST